MKKTELAQFAYDLYEAYTALKERVEHLEDRLDGVVDGLNNLEDKVLDIVLSDRATAPFEDSEGSESTTKLEVGDEVELVMVDRSDLAMRLKPGMVGRIVQDDGPDDEPRFYVQYADGRCLHAFGYQLAKI